jgi:hypothetical protein
MSGVRSSTRLPLVATRTSQFIFEQRPAVQRPESEEPCVIVLRSTSKMTAVDQPDTSTPLIAEQCSRFSAGARKEML